MIRSHKIRLKPNNVQETLLRKSCGVARFAYNWALSEWNKQYAEYVKDPANNPKPSKYTLRKQLNAIKREQFPWMLEVTKCAPMTAIENLHEAFQRFVKKTSKRPVFHKKGRKDSFKIGNDAFCPTDVQDYKIRIARIGWINMREKLRFNGKLMSATISRTADQWFVSIAVDVPESPIVSAENQGAVGIDLGINSMVTLSTGEKINGPKPLGKYIQRLRQLSRNLSRKVKGSRNHYKAKMKLSRLHLRIANIRNYFMRNLTTRLAKDFSIIGIEDLNVSGMVKNRHLARSLSDMSFGEFRRQLEYKAKRMGKTVVLYPRFRPSSKLCSVCGHVLETLPLSQREWECPKCHTVHDRDTNAAVAIRDYAVNLTVNACGAISSGCQQLATKLVAVKQEIPIGTLTLSGV